MIGWANESFEIAVDPDVEYCVMVGDVCQYTATEVTFTGQRKDVDADADYLAMHSATVRERLKMAAVRLASLLNEIWQ